MCVRVMVSVDRSTQLPSFRWTAHRYDSFPVSGRLRPGHLHSSYHSLYLLMVCWISLRFIHGDNRVHLSLYKSSLPFPSRVDRTNTHLTPLTQEPEVVYAGLIGPL